MPNSIEKMVYNAIKQRYPEFREIFTGPYSLIGQEGGTIKTLRIDHKKVPRNYKKRRVFKINA